MTNHQLIRCALAYICAMITHGNIRNAPARSGSADDRLTYHIITCPPKTGDILHNSTIAVSPDRVRLVALCIYCACAYECLAAPSPVFHASS